MKRFALAGNPNCGKTTLFNSLTGSTAHVGNWPGVTVDKRDGVYKKCAEPISIVDLPGIYSLSPYTPEEVIARNYVLDEKPDCVINIVDATNLERNLYLTTQLLEIDVPMVVALNMIDAVEKAGDKIDEKALENKLGVPVVKISALKEKGLKELMDKAYNESKKKRVGITVLKDSPLAHVIGDVKIALEGQNVANPLFHAVKLVENDEIEVKMHKETVGMVSAFKKTFNDDIFGNDFEALVADARYKYISKNFAPVVTRKNKEKFKTSASDKADKVLTHKVWGIPIFLVVLFLIFHLTFSENLFFINGFGDGWMPSLSDNEAFLEKDDDGNVVYEDDLDYYMTENGDYLTVGSEGVTDNGNGTYSIEGEDGEFVADDEGRLGSRVPVLNYGGRWLATIYDGTIYSPGVVVNNIWNDMIVGEIAGRIQEAVDGSGMADWAKGLINNGIIDGITAVLSFLPPILVLFLFFSILEDSGYMARAAFIVDKLMHRIGLHGKSFIPMVMGFGCNVPAIMATRAIESRKSRLITIAIIPFMSCAGRLPIFVLLAGAFFPHNSALALLGIYFLGVLMAILSAVVLSRFIKEDDLPFVMELPPYRVPTGKAIWRHTWEKGKQYLEKMATTILIGSVVIWCLGYFPRSDKGAEYQQEHSYIGQLGKAVSPALDPLGFSWKMDIGLLTGVVAKELVVSTLGVMYASDEPAVSEAVEAADTDVLAADTQLQGTLARSVTLPAAVAYMIFILLYFPCIATFVAIKNETGKWRWAIAVCAYTMVVAWLAAFIGFHITALLI